MVKTKIDLDEQMAEFLPEALEQVIATYKKYAAVEESAKEFKDAQGACKVAVGHMALLMKLGEQVKECDQGLSAGRMEELLMRAQEELDGFQDIDNS